MRMDALGCGCVQEGSEQREKKKSRRPVSAWNEDERVKEEGTTDRKVSLLPDIVCVCVCAPDMYRQNKCIFFFF